MSERSQFEKVSEAAGRQSLFWEFVDFLAQNKKWWLLPIAIVMALLGVLIILSNSAIAPFIYTLF